MTDYIIEKIKYENSNSSRLEYAKVRLFNNTKRKPFYINSYNLRRDQIIAAIRAGKTFYTFYAPDNKSRKPKLVDSVFLVETSTRELFLKVNKDDDMRADTLGPAPKI